MSFAESRGFVLSCDVAGCTDTWSGLVGQDIATVREDARSTVVWGHEDGLDFCEEHWTVEDVAEAKAARAPQDSTPQGTAGAVDAPATMGPTAAAAGGSWSHGDYQAANLREGLLTLRALSCDTGDWLGEILNQIPETLAVQPNQTVAQQLERIRFSRPVLAILAAHDAEVAAQRDPRYAPEGEAGIP